MFEYLFMFFFADKTWVLLYSISLPTLSLRHQHRLGIGNRDPENVSDLVELLSATSAQRP